MNTIRLTENLIHAYLYKQIVPAEQSKQGQSINLDFIISLHSVVSRQNRFRLENVHCDMINLQPTKRDPLWYPSPE